MRIMFVGSNPEGSGALAFERDITVLQRRLMNQLGLDASFVFLPSCPVEELPQQLAECRPEILHFAAHGEDGENGGNLVLADALKRPCRVTAEMIHAFLDPESPPRLVYLSACNSADIARKLSALGQAAIGATAPITNSAARASAVCFYDRLFRGLTVQQAHSAARALLTSMHTADAAKVDSELHEPAQRTLGQTILVRVPRIVAEPVSASRVLRDGRAQVDLRIGLMDFPRDTARVVFFTPDSSFKNGVELANTDDFTGNACWTEGWEINGDFLISVAGASASSMTFSGAVMVVDAMRNCLRYRPRHRRSTDAKLKQAIELLTEGRLVKGPEVVQSPPGKPKGARAEKTSVKHARPPSKPGRSRVKTVSFKAPAPWPRG